MAAAGGSSATTKAVVDDSKPTETSKEQQKPAAALEEDDEFEDFPVEGSWIPECDIAWGALCELLLKGLGADAWAIL